MVCAEGKAKEQKPKLHSCNRRLCPFIKYEEPNQCAKSYLFTRGKCVLAGKKNQRVEGTMGILCQSARGFLLPPRTQSQQHSCGHKTTSARQRDRQTDQGLEIQTNKDKQEVKMHRQWLALTVFNLSQLFQRCQVHIFLCALFVSVTHIKVSKVETMAKERAADSRKKHVW